MAVPVLSGTMLAAAYGPLCRAAGLFPGVPSGALIGLAQGLAAASVVSAMSAGRKGGAMAVMTAGITVIAMGVTAGHMLLGVAIGFLGAASERRERFVSRRFLTWLERQREEEGSGLERGELRSPIQISRHQAQRVQDAPDTSVGSVAARAA